MSRGRGRREAPRARAAGRTEQVGSRRAVERVWVLLHGACGHVVVYLWDVPCVETSRRILVYVDLDEMGRVGASTRPREVRASMPWTLRHRDNPEHKES